MERETGFLLTQAVCAAFLRRRPVSLGPMALDLASNPYCLDQCNLFSKSV